MPTLDQIAGLRASSTLLTRFMVAVERTATLILVEADVTANHDKRLAWANKCMFEADRSQRYADVIRKAALHLDPNFATDGEAIADAAIKGIVDTYANVLALKDL